MSSTNKIVRSWLVTAVGLGGCVAPASAPLDDNEDVTLAAEASALPFPGLDAGTTRGGLACRSARHRGFDFWLGSWSITQADGTFGGVSSISKEVGGCAVMEAYQGGAGRSLNLYDRLRDRWTQFYIDNGSALLLRLSGNVVDGVMDMEDEVRTTASGLALKSQLTWTPLADGSVRQRWLLSNDGGASYGVAFDGTYATAAPSSPEVTPSQICQTIQPAFRAADFLLGTWTVHAEHGNRIGTTTVRATAGGCLLEEDFLGRGGYSARAFLAYDRVTRTWYRQQGDSVGFVFEQAGSAANNTFSVTGESFPGVITRMTWSASGADQLVQRWEVSADGVQFVTVRTLSYRRTTNP